MDTARARYAAELSSLPDDQVAAYLTARSNLPGPRSNLTLLDAAGDVLPAALALRFADADDEYLACCGVVTLGRLILADPADASVMAQLTARADDGRWRVREAAAMAAQRVGDDRPDVLRDLVAGWVASPAPLVVRAGIAAICEPRLLADPATAAAAIAACRSATAALQAVPPGRRHDPDVRTLRQGLGYCWSVAVAGDPVTGLEAFAALDVTDPDVAWVVRENRKKARLRRLLG